MTLLKTRSGINSILFIDELTVRRRSSLFLQEYIQAKGHTVFFFGKEQNHRKGQILLCVTDVRQICSVRCDSAVPQQLYLRPRGVSVAVARGRPNTCRNTSPVNSPAAKWSPMTAPPSPRFVAVCYDFAIYIVCVVRWTSVTSVNTAVGGSECLQTLPTSEIYF